MTEEMKLYFEFDEYQKKHGDGCVDAFVLEKIKALHIPDFPDKARELVAKALCDTVHNATENLKAILAPGVNASAEASKLQSNALTELRDAIGRDEDIPKERKKPLLRRFCSWLVGRSWEETKILATEVVEDGETSEKLPDDFKLSTLNDKGMPDGINDSIQETVGILGQAAQYNMMMAQGAISGRVIDVLENADENSSYELPVVVRNAFETDILSPDEEMLKKLVALERLLYAVREEGRDVLLSPLVVIGIARDAFVHVNDTKATIKELEERAMSDDEEVKS
jgi:hypothetical protein